MKIQAFTPRTSLMTGAGLAAVGLVSLILAVSVSGDAALPAAQEPAITTSVTLDRRPTDDSPTSATDETATTSAVRPSTTTDTALTKATTPTSSADVAADTLPDCEENESIDHADLGTSTASPSDDEESTEASEGAADLLAEDDAGDCVERDQPDRPERVNDEESDPPVDFSTSSSVVSTTSASEAS